MSRLFRERKILRDQLCNLIRAGEGNRTLVLSLGSSRSAIELHPQSHTSRETLLPRYEHVDTNASKYLCNSERWT